MPGLCRPAALAILFALAFVIACGGGDSLGSPAPTLGPPTFTESSCLFAPPVDEEVRCGYVNVPQRHDEPGAGSLQLPVAIVEAHVKKTKAADPIIFLDGGPGVATLASLTEDQFEFLIRPFLIQRDFILYDQRGVGFAEPALECPEVDFLPSDASIPRSRYTPTFVKAAKDCHDRLLAAGIDPTLANSRESAADLEDIRVALGYDSWNLFGISYGTRLALTTMRDHPEHIRSVILDSTYPPEVDIFAESPDNLHRALQVLFADYQSDNYCQRISDDLESDLYDAIEELEGDPEELYLSYTPYYNPFELDGEFFAYMVYQSLYSTDTIPSIPDLIAQTSDGDYEAVTVVLEFYGSGSVWQTFGAFASVECSEEAPFTSRELVDAQLEEHAQLKGAFHGGFGPDMLEVCTALALPSPEAVEAEAVSSDIPTLVLSGDYDPVTPPAWGQQVADRLTNSFFFILPNVGHGVMTGSQCGEDLAVEFMDNPQTDPANPCLQDLSAPDFSASLFAPIE